MKEDSESIAHYESVLLEGIRGEFKLVTESVDLLRESQDRMKEELKGALKELKVEVVAAIDSIHCRLTEHDHEINAQKLG